MVGRRGFCFLSGKFLVGFARRMMHARPGDLERDVAEWEQQAGRWPHGHRHDVHPRAARHLWSRRWGWPGPRSPGLAGCPRSGVVATGRPRSAARHRDPTTRGAQQQRKVRPRSVAGEGGL